VIVPFKTLYIFNFKDFFKKLSVFFLKSIKYRILQLCEINQIPIYKLEEFTGVPTVTINNILYGKSMNPKLNTIKQICDGLDITLAEFFDTDEFNNLEQEVK